MKTQDMTPQKPSALFLDREEAKRWDDFLTAALAAAHARVFKGSVTPTLDIEAFRTELAQIDFAAPADIEATLCWTIDKMEHGLVHLTHPRYFGLFNPMPATPAGWADRIAATFNPQLATWTTSPAAVEIEATVIRAMATRIGLPAGASGHFTTGGAEANYTSVLCALSRAHPGFAADGARAFNGQPTLYTSKESHLAWLKIAHQAGIGRKAVRLVATDGSGRMSLGALSEAIETDRKAGCLPAMVVATAGTTNAGMIDPLAGCRDIAEAAGAWFHVDAAWGGAVVASEKLRPLLAGIEHADSVTIDAHKWFATTMGCGMFLTPHRALLSSVFEVSASYMPSNVRERDPYVTSVQWSRRFLGLRLFLTLAIAGWEGYAQHIERAISLSDLLASRLTANGWRIVNRSPLAVLCIEPPPGADDVRSIVARILASGQVWLSSAVFEGGDVIRACVTHGQTTEDDIQACTDALTDALAVKTDVVYSPA